MSYEIIQEEPGPVREGDPLPDIDEYPILNQQEAVKYECRLLYYYFFKVLLYHDT